MNTETLLQIAILPLLGWVLKKMDRVNERLASIETRIDRIEMHLDPKVEIFPVTANKKAKAK